MAGSRHLVILGQMGSGKTTVGELVAATLGRQFHDNDTALTARTGSTAAEIQTELGRERLHALERQVVDELLAAQEPTVIAAPASIVLGMPHRALQERAFTAWLLVSPSLLAQRVATSSHRPLPVLDRDVWFEQLAAERDLLYRANADVVVDADALAPDEVADEIVRSYRASTRQRSAAVDLFWIPVGAGGATPIVRWSTRLVEHLLSRLQRRRARDLYHAAMQVHLDGARHDIEMGPAWGRGHGHGVVAEGPVGLRLLGRSRLFRYEVRRCLNGVIPDLSEAVGAPVRVTDDPVRAQRVLDLAPDFPTAVWGRDELGAGDMWNSNSLIAWLLVGGGLDLEGVRPPKGGRAPGWTAGIVVASRNRSQS